MRNISGPNTHTTHNEQKSRSNAKHFVIHCYSHLSVSCVCVYVCVRVWLWAYFAGVTSYSFAFGADGFHVHKLKEGGHDGCGGAVGEVGVTGRLRRRKRPLQPRVEDLMSAIALLLQKHDPEDCHNHTDRTSRPKRLGLSFVHT